MKSIIKKPSDKAGMPPGTVMHIGEKRTEPITITVIDYNETDYKEITCSTIEECFPYADQKDTVTWVNIDGIHQPEIIKTICDHYQIHPLVQEDIVNTHQRPKIEDYDTYLYVVIKMLYKSQKDSKITSEQISLILYKNLVMSFQEQNEDVFNTVRDRIKQEKGRIRTMHADYLLYALMDIIVDTYFEILEQIGDKIDNIEEDILTNPRKETMQILHMLKRDMISFRKSISPLREVVNKLERGELPYIEKKTTHYFRDVYDHTIQTIDTIENQRDLLSGLLDMYLSSISNKMNDVMKVLTIFASIFIPLTFIAGIYGMNFEDMPELTHPLGYPLILLLMLSMSIVMLFYFRQKKWL